MRPIVTGSDAGVVFRRRSVPCGLIVAWFAVTPVAAGQTSAARDVTRLANDASKALDEKRHAEALAGFVAAAKLEPQDASIALGVGYAATILGQWK
jgi:hypothetical protein